MHLIQIMGNCIIAYALLTIHFKDHLDNLCFLRFDMKDTELAKVLHIDRATLKRIIGGDTEKVSSQVIIDAAQYFGVSTDFPLGLTDMPDPMNHPVKEFGLTVPAARAILSEDVHKEMLNRLLENQRFGQLTHTMFYALKRAKGKSSSKVQNNALHVCGFLD